MGARPATPALLALAASERARLGQPFVTGGDDGETVPLGVVVVAVGLLVAAMGGVGFAAGRSRARR